MHERCQHLLVSPRKRDRRANRTTKTPQPKIPMRIIFLYGRNRVSALFGGGGEGSRLNALFQFHLSLHEQWQSNGQHHYIRGDIETGLHDRVVLVCSALYFIISTSWSVPRNISKQQEEETHSLELAMPNSPQTACNSGTKSARRRQTRKQRIQR